MSANFDSVPLPPAKPHPSQNPHVTLNAGINISIDYSSRHGHSSLFAPPIHSTKPSESTENSSATTIPLNVLSSSIQAGIDPLLFCKRRVYWILNTRIKER